MPPKSIKPFVFILIAQSISIFGSSLTAFALGVWIYQEVGSTTIYALIAFANGMPMVLLSPFAGTLVDRMNRKKVMLVSQLASLCIALLLMGLYWQNALEPWHIIALVALNSFFMAFMMPAISATIPLMVPTGQLTRVNGMIALSLGLIQLTSPALSGTLYHNTGLKPIFVLDIITFCVGLGAILLTVIPQPRTSIQKTERVTQSLRTGFKFIVQSASLSSNIVFYSIIAAVLMSMGILIQPMLLAILDSQTMGFIMSFAGSGIILGSAWMIFMKDVRYHMPIILIATCIAGVACIITPMARTPVMLALGGFLIMCCYPIFEANNRALLQRKIDPAILGRVIGWRNFTMGIAQSIVLLGSGLVVDNFFEPAMAADGQFANIFGYLYGVGKGRGIALFLSLLGVLVLVSVILAGLFTPLRRMDSLMTDHVEPDISPDQESAQEQKKHTAIDEAALSCL